MPTLHPTNVTFRNRDILSAATLWTKQRIFNAAEGQRRPVSPRSKTNVDCNGANRPNGPSLSFSSDCQIVAVYDNCVQIWKYLANGDLGLVGSTGILEGRVISAVLIDRGIVVQIQRARDFLLEVHLLNDQGRGGQGDQDSGFEETREDAKSLVYPLVLPPSSSGSGPYHLYSSSSSTLAVVSSTGSVTLFSVNPNTPQSLSVHLLCPLETQLASDGTPLLDIQGDWLVFSPKTSPPLSTHTPLNLPPSGALYERVVENLSSTAAVSLKSLSDAGVAGIKHYLHGNNNNDDNYLSGIHNGGYKHTLDSGIHSPASNRSSPNTNPGSRPLSVLSGLLFPDQATQTTVQIIDLKTSKTLACFVPLCGASRLSLSPHDTALAVVSTKGDVIYTYDLSFVPNEVAVTGRYVRGKLPSVVTEILWDAEGAFGVVTAYKGTLHWFDKRRSFDSSNKVWKLSGWGIQQAEWFMNPRTKESLVLVARENEILVVNREGACRSKYELSHEPVSLQDDEDLLCNGSETSVTNYTSRSRDGEPLSYFELETCMPYPFIHTDRRVILSKFNDPYGLYKTGADDHKISLPVFAVAMDNTVIDFGNSDGQVKFSPGQESIELDDLEEEEIIRRARESVVLPISDNISTDNARAPLIKGEDGFVLE